VRLAPCSAATAKIARLPARTSRARRRTRRGAVTSSYDTASTSGRARSPAARSRAAVEVATSSTSRPEPAAVTGPVARNAAPIASTYGSPPSASRSRTLEVTGTTTARPAPSSRRRMTTRSGSAPGTSARGSCSATSSGSRAASAAASATLRRSAGVRRSGRRRAQAPSPIAPSAASAAASPPSAAARPSRTVRASVTGSTASRSAMRARAFGERCGSTPSTVSVPVRSRRWPPSADTSVAPASGRARIGNRPGPRSSSATCRPGARSPRSTSRLTRHRSR